MINWVEVLGLVAAACTTISFVPQVVKTYRTRSGQGVSLGMYSLFLLGVCLWLVYGVIINNWPIILANIITLTLGLSIVIMIRVFSRREKRRGL